MHSIRRWLATAALVMLLPMAWQLTNGQIGLLDAGKRAAILFAAVLIIGRFLIFGVRQLADTLDGSWEGRAARARGAAEESERPS